MPSSFAYIDPECHWSCIRCRWSQTWMKCGVVLISKELEPTEGWRSRVQHNLNVCCQRLSMMVKKMSYEMKNEPHFALQVTTRGCGLEDCFEIINLSKCTDEATSCTVGCWAAQRNTKQQTGRSKHTRELFCIPRHPRKVWVSSVKFVKPFRCWHWHGGNTSIPSWHI